MQAGAASAGLFRPGQAPEPPHKLKLKLKLKRLDYLPARCVGIEAYRDDLPCSGLSALPANCDADMGDVSAAARSRFGFGLSALAGVPLRSLAMVGWDGVRMWWLREIRASCFAVVAFVHLSIYLFVH